jgi:hypothetical protein
MMNHLDKYTIDADILESYKRASMYLLYGAMIKAHPVTDHTEYPVGLTRYRDPSKLCQDRIMEPSAQPLSHMDNDEFDMYNFSFSDDKNHLIADILYLEYATNLCILSLDNNDEVIVDIMASAIHNMQQDQISKAHMYLSCVQSLLSFIGEKDFLDKQHVQQYDGAQLDPADLTM